MADGSMMTTEFNPATDSRAFRDALGCFGTGVTLVTTMGADGPMGFVANSFAGVSLSPPLVLWSPARSSNRFAQFSSARYYSIHILGQEQQALTERFGRNGPGFSDLPHDLSPEHSPLLANALARFDCEQHAAHDGGDHLIIVGRVLRATLRDGDPLLFVRGKMTGFGA